MKAVILAGGKGTRLRPYTYVVPKPLLPFKERPLLEHIIRHLRSAGISDIILSIGYLGYQIKNYFGDGSDFGVRIRYSEERVPLGTAGCLNLIRDRIDDTFLLFGGDNLTSALNLKDFIKYHKKRKAILTAAIFELVEKLRYGIYKLDSAGRIIAFDEKPEMKYLAGTMIFCMQPEIFRYIPEQKGMVNLTDHVIPRLLREKENVCGYVFSGEWIDIGSPEDYTRINGSVK
ncbi:MAG: nucleotidyltransferase family protein [Candidatus Aenigmarchaeota archaeon]|nr:nucleotidyltransferase family protein [Candidatus Aenigmarchaeota archaeon]